jgi:methyl-accepting chemotaxis protein
MFSQAIYRILGISKIKNKKKGFSMSVKFKIIGLTVISILFSVTMITVVAVISFNKALTESSEERLAMVIDDKGKLITTIFNDYSSLLTAIAQSELARNSLMEFTNDFEKIEKEVSVNQEAVVEELIAHYDTKYLDLVDYSKDGSSRRLTTQYLPEKNSGKIAQKIFILDNPNKIGEKNLLEFNPKYEFISYVKTHKKYHQAYNTFLTKFGLYDIFLVNKNGDIVYTTYKEKDFATNLRRDVYKLSGLGRAFFKGLALKDGELGFEDFSFYEPSYNAPASFISSPIYVNGKVEGTIIFQLPISQINDILTRDRHGETDEMYIVGNDYKLRSDLRFMDMIKDNPSVARMKTTVSVYEIENDFVKDALSGNLGKGEYINYSGRDTIISYAPLNIFDTKWAIVGAITVQEGTHEAQMIIKSVLTISVIVTILAIILVFVFVDKFMSTPLNRILAMTEDISTGDGDLTQRLPVSSTDEFGAVSKNINHFIERIQGLLNDVKDLVERNLTVSGDVNSLSSAISDRIKSSNKTLSIIADSGKNISSNLRETTTNIKDTKEIITESNKILIEAREEIQQLARKVGTASVNQKSLSGKLAHLSDNAEKIKEVLFVIDDIADQTNLLALNAAIEAARAGEFGKGFAVVAFEVTKLADKTQESLADVNKIVTIVLDEMKEAVNLMQKSSTSISELSVVSSDASRRITDTSDNIQDSVKIIETSVLSAIDATSKTSDIVEKIQQIVRLSNENTKNIEEMLDSSKELNSSGEALDEKLSHYKS